MPCTIELSDDEALVLFEFLSREVDERNGAGLADALVSPAEFWALNAVHCLLEKALTTPFQQNYVEAVTEARGRLDPGAETEIVIECRAADSAAMGGPG